MWSLVSFFKRSFSMASQAKKNILNYEKWYWRCWLSRRTSWTGDRSQISHRGVKFDLDLSIIYSFSVREDGACGLTPVWTWTWLSRINPALIARFENDTTNHVMSLLIISRESKQISQKVALVSHTFCHTQYNTTQS